MPTQPDARALTIEMVRASSVTNTDGERAFAAHLHGMISREAYFQEHPRDVWLQTIENDPFSRSNVCALVRGSGTKTVVLTGHYDVVSAANYGPLEPWAFEPEELLERTVADLRVNARSDAEHRALTDFESGDFLSGRGLLDMKSGLAAGLVALYRFAQLQERVGNVLFVAVADEEDSSHGARDAAPMLSDLARRENLEIVGVINLDATSDSGDGSSGRAVYLGSIGKVLVSVLAVGVDTHAGYALDGINVNYLMSEVSRRLECNPVLADRTGAEVVTPPTSLRQVDLKTQYDVTTPARAWACFNVLTGGKPASAILNDFKLETQTALEEALRTLRARAEALGVTHAAAHGATPLALTFSELLEAARRNADEGFDAKLEAFTTALPAQLDLPTQSQRVTSWLWDEAGLLGPAVVLGFGSLHYPSTMLEERNPADAHLFRTVRATLETARLELGVSVVERGYFMGISDMSWFGHGKPEDIEFVNRNTPAPRAHITAMPSSLPVVNLGPWGRDYHQWLERAYAPYTFVELPELVWRISRDLLGNGE
jgi:arginine utilization protein RocB